MCSLTRYEELTRYFGVSINEAGEALGMCTSAIKKVFFFFFFKKMICSDTDLQAKRHVHAGNVLLLIYACIDSIFFLQICRSARGVP